MESQRQAVLRAWMAEAALTPRCASGVICGSLCLDAGPSSSSSFSSKPVGKSHSATHKQLCGYSVNRPLCSTLQRKDMYALASVQTGSTVKPSKKLLPPKPNTGTTCLQLNFSRQGRNDDVSCPGEQSSGHDAQVQRSAASRSASQAVDLQWRPTRRALVGISGAAVVLGSLPGVNMAKAAEDKVDGQGGRSMPWLLGEIQDNLSLNRADKGPESRIYDASVLGMPVVVADRTRVWERLTNSRVVYLGEAESVPDPGDKVLEFEIIKKLQASCAAGERALNIVMETFPRPMQQTLDKFLKSEVDEEQLMRLYPDWARASWEEFYPLLRYCRDNDVRVVAAGVPPEVVRKVQAKGIYELNNSERRVYAPPLGGGYSGHFVRDTLPYDLDWPRSFSLRSEGVFLDAQARAMEDHTMAVAVGEALTKSSTCIIVVITGASHVMYGSRGNGVPFLVAGKMKKPRQAVILLNRERQRLRQEGDVPEGDFLWYSAGKACTENCFNRAEVARVMSAAGRTREALPLDIQEGVDRGLVSPDILRSFFELDQHPLLAAAAQQFQGLRERWLADPLFLHRLAIEEAISITTTLAAQYRKRGARFSQELEYVITDTTRGAVVDFFTVWLPAPTLSFRDIGGSPDVARGFWNNLFGNLPDNAFQRAGVGQSWSLEQRVLSVVVGGIKLCAVGMVSSLGTVGISNAIVNLRKRLSQGVPTPETTKRSPVLKTAVVYGGFLATSSNIRYQVIAGIVEHWIADYYLAGIPMAGAVLSFGARTVNSYWGTSQWVDMARHFGLQSHQVESQKVAPVDDHHQPLSWTPPQKVITGDKEQDQSLSLLKSTPLVDHARTLSPQEEQLPVEDVLQLLETCVCETGDPLGVAAEPLCETMVEGDSNKVRDGQAEAADACVSSAG